MCFSSSTHRTHRHVLPHTQVLDETKDNPSMLPGRTAGLTSTVTSMDLKIKKGVMDLKRKLMEVGQKKKDEL